MNHKERVLAAVDHQPVDRIPTDLWATPEVHRLLFEHFQVETIPELYDCLGIDGIMGIVPVYIGPSLKQGGETWEDYWGVEYVNHSYETGVYPEFAKHPLKDAESIADLESFRWPSADWFDYSTLLPGVEAYSGRAIMCGYSALFHTHNKLRGMEESLLDPILRPDFTHYLLSRIADFFTEYHRRCFEAVPGRIDLTEVTDDWGSQQGLITSPQIFEEFYRAPMEQAVNLAKSFNVRVFHHDDGDMRKLLPTFAELGIDVLNPIQWRTGNWDLGDLKKRFGKQICFHGGVDNQQTLPFGTREEVRSEVRRLIRQLSSDQTGYILAPCHNIQTDTPVENILAIYAAAEEFGGFSKPGGWKKWFFFWRA